MRIQLINFSKALRMFGKCKCCEEKEKRIAELKEHLSYFKAVLHPEAPSRKYRIETDMETDMVLEGGGKDQIDLEAENLENERIQKEQDLIFSQNDERADS
jgi:hypothetical protein